MRKKSVTVFIYAAAVNLPFYRFSSFYFYRTLQKFELFTFPIHWSAYLIFSRKAFLFLQCNIDWPVFIIRVRVKLD